MWKTHLTMKRRWCVGLMVLPLLSTAAACGQAQSGLPNTTVAPTTTAPPLPGGYGLLPADPHLTDRISLTADRVTPGRVLNGTLVVVNDGTAPINLTKPCRPDFVVALTNSSYAPQVAFATMCSSAPLIIASGTNRFPIQVMTTYVGCSPGGPQAPEPACTANGGPPPLPGGNYDAVLIGFVLPLPEPHPVAVQLTASAR